ncbi:hypothetical protein [Pseudomonas putida]|uniref:hypothetical protein n=1 Tax=Pseudomonas putida TaxID=303 RepID=UPI001629CF1B|nr:hypothetical protein [Pseudomonas putida]QNG07209.1 hypothetical protein GPM17_01035 [Pseudomonas putida]HDS1059582.1 hypothetical protein [Pseudomonas putida]
MNLPVFKPTITAAKPFRQTGLINGKACHAFTVPEGVDANDALEEASSIMSTTFDMITEAGFGNMSIEGNFAWMLLNTLESAKALLDAVIAGMESEEEILAALHRCRDQDMARESNIGGKCGTQRDA